MNRFLSTSLFLFSIAGVVHCAAPTEDSDVPAVDLSVDPKVISGASTGDSTGTDSVEKTADGGTKEGYLKIELKNVLVTSW